MPTKATSKSNTKKPAPRGTRPADRKPSASDSQLKPGQETPAPESEEKPKPVKKTAISLLKEDRPAKKAEPGPAASKPQGSILPPISRIRAPQATPAPEPEPKPEPEAEPAAAPEATPAGEATDAKVIHIKPPIIVRDLAGHLNLKPYQLIQELMQMNIFAALNHTIEPEVAARICETHGYIFEVERREKGGGVHKPVEVAVEAPEEKEVVIEEQEQIETRPPIVTFMGHVDHGKTSLLDYIRKSRVTVGEAGGITQHMGAYAVEHNGHAITFLDTPGHAAFTAMRARGANVTDIVVLVVAADDGIMPQTLEAINHAKAAGVAIVVAINKIDVPGANVDKVKGQLQEHGLQPEDWGGEVICCPVSAIKGDGMDDLLESILLQAEILELQSSASAEPRGIVIEAQMEPGRGPTATVIVRHGTFKTGQAFICGNYSGKVKSLLSDAGKPIKSAGPSTPVKILGFAGLPNAGDEIVVMKRERDAKSLSDERLNKLRTEKLATPPRPTLETLMDSFQEGEKKVLRLIVKADVQGSLEATVSALNEIKSDKIDLEILHFGVGPISESDVLLASASNAILIGFGVKIENLAVSTAKREGVQIKLFSIIYELIDQVKEAMAGLLDPELRETVLGRAEVKQVFQLNKGKVAGCFVAEGRIVKTGRARVLRGRQSVYDGGIATLKRFRDEVSEVRSGVECGIKLGDYNEYEPGDVIECYQLEKVQQKL